MRRVSIRWTATAREQLAGLEPKVRKGIIAKADELADCDDPKSAYKPLQGPLSGFYRLTYARYRAVYSIEEERLADESIVVHITITFIAVGKRKEHDKKDIYKIAERLVSSNIIDLPPASDSASP